MALPYASDELRNDPEIIFKALTTLSITKKPGAPSTSSSSNSAAKHPNHQIKYLKK